MPPQPYYPPFHGDKLYQRRAVITLPYLVMFAKAGTTITYDSLAQLVNIPNPRNLNYVLGAIGGVLVELSKGIAEPIPPIQCLVTNKTTGLPGEGISGFITNYFKLPKAGKRRIVDLLLVDVFHYPHWDWVLEELNLKPVSIITDEELIEAGQTGRSGGESEEHKHFKEFVAANPQIFGINGVLKGITEVLLPSGDRLDVVFDRGNSRIAVEVKSKRSSKEDILRGLFQCVKYKYIIEAAQIVQGKQPDSRVILALQGTFPSEYFFIQNLLSVEVKDNIQC